jgi:L-amino acid N-acyltransferase YncA
MPDIVVRATERRDLSRLTDIYNYYIVNTAITFDLKPFTVEERTDWFEIHSAKGR